MNKQRLNVVAEAPRDGSRSTGAWRRDLALAVTVVAILVVGAAMSGPYKAQETASTAPQPATATPTPTPAPSEDFVYFPSQYVNQGTEITEPIATF